MEIKNETTIVSYKGVPFFMKVTFPKADNKEKFF